MQSGLIYYFQDNSFISQIMTHMDFYFSPPPHKPGFSDSTTLLEYTRP